MCFKALERNGSSLRAFTMTLLYCNWFPAVQRVSVTSMQYIKCNGCAEKRADFEFFYRSGGH